jgi:uncharacterized protein YdaU (DUF1376 family)
MHYYQFNIGDYKSHTEHLSEMEDLTYRRLLDWYYLHETPIPLDLNEVARQIRMRSHTECIATVLEEYFESSPNGWIHHRANAELAKAGDKSQKAKASAKARWNKSSDANALPTQSESNATHNTRHKTQNTESKLAAVQQVIDLYNEILPELPSVRLMTDKRKKSIGSFLTWVLASKKSDGTPRATNVEEALVWTKAYFDRARDNDFLMARDGTRSGSHANWRCDLDFLLSEKGRIHVIEKTG